MAVALVQFGSSLALIDPDTGASNTLALPDGVTIDSTKRPSVAALDLGAAIVNSPSRNLLLISTGTLVLLAPAKPSTSLVAAVGAAGVLTGNYKYAFSFIRKDGSGNIITESAMSAFSNTVALTADQADLTSIDVSTDTTTVTGRRLYRTLSGGSILFFLADIDNNSATTYTDNTADAALSILPENGHRTFEIPGTNASDTSKLRLITTWKNRLWGVTNNARKLDDVNYTDDGLPYRWGTGGANTLVAEPKGVTSTGVVGFIARRDQLGIGRRDGLWQITGDSDLSFRIIRIAVDRGGLIGQRSVVVQNDEAFYHGPDGVNFWNDEGVRSLSDATVKPWFSTDRYFKRSEFPNSFAKFNGVRNQYELHLVEVGQSVSQVWIAFNRDAKTFYGIHRTGIANLTCASAVGNLNGVPRVLVGSASGQVYSLDPETYHDATATAIALRVTTPKYLNSDPGRETNWGRLSVVTRPETKGFLTVEATTGRLDDDPQTNLMLVDLTEEYAKLRHLGKGTTVQLEFSEASVDQPVAILGFDVPGLWTTKR